MAVATARAIVTAIISVSDPFSFVTDPDPAFYAEYRSGSNQDPGF